jgi:hypothetical protein
MRTIQKAKPERAIALQNGQNTYFTGRACKHGHISPRFTIDASCVECRAVALETWRREHTKLKAREKRKFMSANERMVYRSRNAERVRLDRKLNPEKYREQERKHSRLKRMRHPERKLAEVRKRQASKLKRTPVWADLAAIKKFYENCPDGHEVDHIAPLRGKTVCGLHVLTNLQYLPAADNRAKGCSFDSVTYSAQELTLWKQRLLDLEL